MKRKIIISLFLILVIVIAGCSQNNSDENADSNSSSDYPEKTIKLIVPYPPGGGTDTVARAIEDSVNDYIPNDQQVVVENVEGGTGTVGNTQVYNAEDDGYTIGLVTIETLSVQPHLGNTEYTYDSFQPIARLTSEPQIFAVRDDAPWDTFEEWEEYVEDNPGEFTYATPGPGSAGHIAMEAIASEENLEVQDLPQEGGGPAKTSVIGEETDGLILTYPELKSEIDEEELKILANVGETKTEPLEDVPTLEELDIDVGLDAYYALVAPEGIPDDALETLSDAFEKASEDSDFIEKFEKMDYTPAYAGPEETQEVITDYYDSIGEVLDEVDIDDE